jgi:hypothetical protein
MLCPRERLPFILLLAEGEGGEYIISFFTKYLFQALPGQFIAKTKKKAYVPQSDRSCMFCPRERLPKALAQLPPAYLCGR